MRRWLCGLAKSKSIAEDASLQDAGTYAVLAWDDEQRLSASTMPSAVRQRQGSHAGSGNHRRSVESPRHSAPHTVMRSPGHHSNASSQRHSGRHNTLNSNSSASFCSAHSWHDAREDFDTVPAAGHTSPGTVSLAGHSTLQAAHQAPADISQAGAGDRLASSPSASNRLTDTGLESQDVGGTEEERVQRLLKRIKGLTQQLQVHKLVTLLGHASDTELSKLQAAGKEQGLDVLHLLHAAKSLASIPATNQNDKGWQNVANGDLQLFYKHSSSEPSVHSFRARCTLDAPVEHPMCLAREFDLNREWNKYCLESTFLQERNAMDVVAYAKLWLPWPLNHIGLIAEAVGADMLEEHGYVAVVMSSPEKLPEGVKAPPSSGKGLQVRFMPNSYLVMEPLPPLAPGMPLRTRVCVSISMDAGIKRVPPVIITFLLRIMAPFIYRQAVTMMREVFVDPHSKMCKRLQQRTDLYPVVQERVARYLRQAKLPKGGIDVAEVEAEVLSS